MGELMTLELPPDSPALSYPWIITFAPLRDEDDWEPVVCGPYERGHALALAEAVAADEELMAVVEPLLPHVVADEIRAEIAAARLAAENDEAYADEDDLGDDDLDDDDLDDDDLEEDDLTGEAFDGEAEDVPPVEPPTPAEVRAGMARIAARLAAPG